MMETGMMAQAGADGNKGRKNSILRVWRFRMKSDLILLSL